MKVFSPSWVFIVEWEVLEWAHGSFLLVFGLPTAHICWSGLWFSSKLINHKETQVVQWKRAKEVIKSKLSALWSTIEAASWTRRWSCISARIWVGLGHFECFLHVLGAKPKNLRCPNPHYQVMGLTMVYSPHIYSYHAWIRVYTSYKSIFA